MMPAKPLVVLLSMLALQALIACQDSSAPQSAEERLVFATFRPGNWDIYYFAAPGAPPKRLTEHPGLDYDPVLSPDGRWVVFTSERTGTPDLFVLDLRDGGPPRLLIESDAMEDQAALSADGHTLIFVSTRDGDADLFSLPFEPELTPSISDAVNLSRHPGGDFRPAVSPDGRWIAFSSDRAHPPGDNANPIARLRGGDLFLMETSGGPARRLTITQGWSGSPTWSPDSGTLYFYRREIAGRAARFSLWAIHPEGGPNGSEPWNVLDDPQAVLSPAAMPDGRIAFASGRPTTSNGSPAGAFAIYSVRPDGSDRRLESDAANGYMAPFFAAGAMVAHGPGPIPADVPQTGAASLLGPGPLLTPGAPWRRSLPDRELRVYPLRELMAAAHPAGDSVLRTPPPGPRLIISGLDGSGAREVLNLNNPGIPAVGVAASPDGEWLVYMQGAMFGGPDQEADLWRVRRDGTGAKNITPDSPGNDGFASYSPDGSWIAFRSGRTGNYEIYRMDAEGGRVENLTSHPARDVFPAVSPKGDQIAFVSDRDSSAPRLYDVYLMDLGTNGAPAALRRITNNAVQEGHTQFSPDGEWLVFTSEMGGLSDEEPLVQSFLFSPQMYGEIYAYRIADGLLVRLTHDKWEDGFPTWVRASAAGSP